MPTLWLLAITVCIVCFVVLQRGCQSGREQRWEHQKEWREQRDKRKEANKDSRPWGHKDKDKQDEADGDEADGDEANQDRKRGWFGRRTGTTADESNLTPEPARLLWEVNKANSHDE